MITTELAAGLVLLLNVIGGGLLATRGYLEIDAHIRLGLRKNGVKLPAPAPAPALETDASPALVP